MWLGDYTVQPENGGLGVFTHEYTHDLGLPDMYDTSGNTGGAENSTAFWTLMSSGANIGDGGPEGIGDDPTDLSAWELLNLGWLGAQEGKGPFYQVVQYGEKANIKLGPNVPGTKSPQAAFVVLPDGWSTGISARGAEAGDYFWAKGKAGLHLDDDRTRRGRGAGGKVRYDIEGWLGLRLRPGSGGRGMGRGENQPLHDDGPAGQQPDGYRDHRPLGRLRHRAWVSLTATLPTGTTAVPVRLQQRPGRVRRRLRRRLRDRRRRRDRGLGVDPRRLPDSGQRRGQGGLLQRLRAGEPPVRRL